MRKITDGKPTEEIRQFLGDNDFAVAEAFQINTYRKLVEQVAKLAFINKDYLLFFRGQDEDYRNKSNASSFYPTIYRGEYLLKKEIYLRFEILNEACRQLAALFSSENISGHQELSRKKYIQWSILQHYSVCATPLLDFTHSLRVACSFSQLAATGNYGYVYVFGLPYITNRISINSEHDLVNIRLLSISPPDALRPYFQEGYLAGTEDITTEYTSKDELDFNNRLIAKFKIPVKESFWGSGFSKIPETVLYPKKDKVREICEAINVDIKHGLLPGQLGEFMIEWNELELEIINRVPQRYRYTYSLRDAINKLAQETVLPKDLVFSLHRLRNFRNKVVHDTKKVDPVELEESIQEAIKIKTLLRAV